MSIRLKTVQRLKNVRFCVLVAVLSLATGSCLPKVDTFNQVAVINGPEETKVWGLSSELEAALRQQLIPGSIRFAPLVGVRHQESIRDIQGDEAVLEAAMLAKDVGAKYGILVNAPIYERTAFLYRELATVHRSVTSQVQLKAVVINADNGEATETHLSKVRANALTRAKES